MNVQGEHSKVQVGAVGFVLNIYFNNFPPRKKKQTESPKISWIPQDRPKHAKQSYSHS